MTPTRRTSGKAAIEVQGLKPGMVRIIEALRRRPMRFNQLCDRTEMARRFVGRYLKELVMREIVTHDAETKMYRLSTEGMKASWIMTNAQFLELHPPSSFCISLGIEGPFIEELGGHLMDVDHAYVAALAYDHPIGPLEKIFQDRFEYAHTLFLSELLRLAVEKGLLSRKALDAGVLPRLSPRMWKRIFRRLCPHGSELIYLERIDLRNLLRYLSHPMMSRSDVSVAVDVRPTERT